MSRNSVLGIGTEPMLQGINAQDSPQALASATRKAARNLIPLLALGYAVASLDRSNIGFAQLEMNTALGLTPATFGFGAGLFFVTYTLFEIPSNLILQKVGPRRWLARILISWGMISASMAFVQGAASFYIARVILGIAEAGWYPGVLLYLTFWFPRDYRARAIAFFYTGYIAAAIFGNPISGLIMGAQNLPWLANWRWLFILEGLPSVALGIVFLIRLRDRPADAEWLTLREQEVLSRTIEEERSGLQVGHRFSFFSAIRSPHVLLFGGVQFLMSTCLASLSIWTPRFVRDLGTLNYFEVGLIAAVPFLFASLAQIACSFSSDRQRERKWHVVFMLAVGGAGFIGAGLSDTPVAGMAFLTLAAVGVNGVVGAYFAMVTQALNVIAKSSTQIAASIAAVTAIANIGGFVGPAGIGMFISHFGNFRYGLIGLACCCLLGSTVIALCRTSFLRAVTDPA